MKARLDEILVSRHLFETIHDAQAAIMAGEVVVGEHRAKSAGQQIANDEHIRIKQGRISKKYVSRGGLKLEHALDEFNISVKNKNCADLGCSTGGFTDCLLKHGAKHVSSIDVGRADFAWELRQDSRISLYENTNVRGLSAAEVQGPFELVVADLSFISIKTVLRDVKSLLQPSDCASSTESSAENDSKNNMKSAAPSNLATNTASSAASKNFITLIKPQFELEKADVSKGGIVKEAHLHEKAIQGVIERAFELGFCARKLTYSPITGRKGNIEFLLLLKLAKANEKPFASINEENIYDVVSAAHVRFKIS